MKNLLNDFKKWLTFWFGIMLMVWIIWWTYAALSNLKVNTSETLTAQLWNDLVDHSVPSWFVWSFYLASCPTGWTAANWSNGTPDLRWAFIRWMNWNLNGRDVARALWNYQTDDFKAHIHTTSALMDLTGWDWTYDHSGISQVVWAHDFGTRTINSSSVWWTETRPKNIALLYCVKN